MDLDTGVYLRTNTTRAFTLPGYHTHSLIHAPQHYVHDSLILVPSQEVTPGPGSLGRKFCLPVLGSSPELDFSQVLKSLGIPWHSSSHPSLISRVVLPAEILNFFPRPLLLFKNPSFCHQHFFLECNLLNLNSLCAEAQCSLSLLLGGSVSCLFINKQEDLGHVTFV